jgi:hypothetical protein
MKKGGWMSRQLLIMHSFVHQEHKTKLQVTFTQGCFCDGMCQNTIPEVLSQKDESQNGVLEPFFMALI